MIALAHQPWRTALVGAALALIAHTVAAAAPAANADLDLRFYAFVDRPAQVSIDGRAMGQLVAWSFEAFAVAPGAHRITVTLGASESASLDVNRQPELMATSRGRRWWCVAVGRMQPANELRVLQLDPAKCAALADRAPADDLPP